MKFYDLTILGVKFYNRMTCYHNQRIPQQMNTLNNLLVFYLFQIYTWTVNLPRFAQSVWFGFAKGDLGGCGLWRESLSNKMGTIVGFQGRVTCKSSMPFTVTHKSSTMSNCSFVSLLMAHSGYHCLILQFANLISSASSHNCAIEIYCRFTCKHWPRFRECQSGLSASLLPKNPNIPPNVQSGSLSFSMSFVQGHNLAI